MKIGIAWRAAVIPCLVLGGPAMVRATIIADSVAEFSGVQGQSNWFYGYWDRTTDADNVYAPSEFSLMTQYLTTPSMDYGPSLHSPCWRVQDGDYWTALWAEGGHPNGTNGNFGHLRFEHWTIRRWVSEVAGSIEISGQLGCSDNFPCSVNGRIFVDGIQVYSQFATGNDGLLNYLVTVPVSAGSRVDISIDSNGVDFDDMTYFTATITPEPMTFGLLSACAFFVRRRSRKIKAAPRAVLSEIGRGRQSVVLGTGFLFVCFVVPLGACGNSPIGQLTPKCQTGYFEPHWGVGLTPPSGWEQVICPSTSCFGEWKLADQASLTLTLRTPTDTLAHNVELFKILGYSVVSQGQGTFDDGVVGEVASMFNPKDSASASDQHAFLFWRQIPGPDNAQAGLIGVVTGSSQALKDAITAAAGTLCTGN